MGRNIFQFVKREDGVVAVIFAVMAIPFIAMGGWAVDYLRLQHVKERLQVQADVAALAANPEPGEDPNALWALVKSAGETDFRSKYQGSWADNMELTAERAGESLITVYASAEVPLAFINILPGIPDTQPVSVSAVAEFFRYQEVRVPPETSALDPEAGDFNRLWMYCYWPDRPEDDPDLPKRTRMVPVADNGNSPVPNNIGSLFTAYFGLNLPTDSNGNTDAHLQQMYDEAIYNFNNPLPLGLDSREEGIWYISDGANTDRRSYRYMWPECAQGSYLSFRLENVRFSRGQQQYWDDRDDRENWAAPNHGGDRITGRFNYYTDTYFNPGSNVEQYDGLRREDGQPVNILETVLCDRREDCERVRDGGIIPEGANRTPQRATGGCEPGKYMYYGWEDRPPGLPGSANNWQHIAWTDRDYDDIQIVMKCPTFDSVGERNARLVR